MVANGKPTGFVVIPQFRVDQHARQDFLAAAADDAQHSVTDEAGCRQFDVVCPQDAADTVIFYEVYDDRAAFDAHLQTPHLQRFQAAMQRLGVEETRVVFASRV